jgi:hypothetical protein
MFNDADCVYVLEGDFDQQSRGYDRWFKVEKTLYLAAWQSAISLCRTMPG